MIAILDYTGAAVVEYTYDAWGNILSTTGSMASTLGTLNPLRYRGYVYDQETELYYLSTRYYNPETGRFLNADAFAATGQGLLGNNMFAYCGNCPMTFFDPTGQYLAGMDLVNFAGGNIGVPSSTSGGALSSSQELSRKGFSENGKPPAFSPGKRKPKELLQIALTVCAEFSSLSDIYPEIKIYEGVDDTIGGINNIKNGASLLFTPVPTSLDDLLGVGLLTLGVWQTAGGFVKTLLGFSKL